MKIEDSTLDFKSSDDPIAAGAIGEENDLKDDVLDSVTEGIKSHELVQSTM